MSTNLCPLPFLYCATFISLEFCFSVMSVRKRRQIPSTVPCPDGSDWYSCPGPLSFAGCCKSNACIRNQCPSGDFVAAITSSLSLSGSSNAPNPNSSGDFVADAYFPASPAGSPDSLNANLSEDIITDIPKSIPQPPDQALNEQPSSSSSSLGLPHSPTANVSSTKFTVPFPFSPEGTLGVPMPPLPTPSTITMTTPLEINSLSSRMTKIAATVGGIGGLVILVLLCVIFMLYRRQKTGEKPSRTHIHECQGISAVLDI